jgi:hypothetical protein
VAVGREAVVVAQVVVAQAVVAQAVVGSKAVVGSRAVVGSKAAAKAVGFKAAAKAVVANEMVGSKVVAVVAPGEVAAVALNLSPSRRLQAGVTPRADPASLSVMLLMSMGMAINLYWMLEVRRTNVEETQIAAGYEDSTTFGQESTYKLDISGLKRSSPTRRLRPHPPAPAAAW